MKQSPPFVDPQAAREQQKYENPVASRELISEVLAAAEGPLSHMTLCQRLGLDDPNAIEALRRRLIAMERDGQLVSNRKGAYAVADKFDLVRGRVQGHRDGYGFVIVHGGGEDIYLTNRQMRKVFDGDEVLVRKGQTDFRGRIEGAIIEVIASGAKTLVGRLYTERGINFLRADNPRVFQDILVPDDALGGAKTGQLVTLEVVDHPFKNRFPSGRVVEVLGEHLAPGVEIDVSIRSHNIPYIWPDDVTAEAAKINPQVLEADKEARIDVRHLPLLTIDGEDARDFDDAVFCEPKRGGGWRLYVAIADVAHYVAVASALDQEAQIRGNSVYFPDYVVPMLPEALSNGLCSLNPAVDRLCMVCEMTISAAGKITGFVFYESVMHSKARLTYNQVGEILKQQGDKHSELRLKFSHVVPHLDELAKLYAVLRSARDERGAIDFDTTETRIIFDDQRKIEKIIPVVRNDAHKLIEECMLAANVCAAKFLEELGVPALYRVHEPPKERKLELLKDFLSELGLSLRNYEDIKPADYQAIIQAIADRPDASLIQTVLLRSMNQAVYSPENKGHFGLAYQAYTHFTSPIRRYPDLLTHRAIRSLVRSDKPSKRVRRHPDALMQPSSVTYPYTMADIIGIGEQCSLSERRADEATRDVVSWLKCEYLQSRVGEVFPGIIGAVVGFGLFVELSDLFVEGLVHISSLPQDYYHHQPAQHRLVGERSGRVFRLGDRLTVKVVRVSLDDRKVDFELMEHLGKSVPDSKSSKANKLEKKPKFITNEQAVKANQIAQAERLAKLGGSKKKHKKKKLSKSERLAKKRGAAIAHEGDSASRNLQRNAASASAVKDRIYNKTSTVSTQDIRGNGDKTPKNTIVEAVPIPAGKSGQGAAIQALKPSKTKNVKSDAAPLVSGKVTKTPAKTPVDVAAKSSANATVKSRSNGSAKNQSDTKSTNKTAMKDQPSVVEVKKSAVKPQSAGATKAAFSPMVKNQSSKTTRESESLRANNSKAVKTTLVKTSSSAAEKTNRSIKTTDTSVKGRKGTLGGGKDSSVKKVATELKTKAKVKIETNQKIKNAVKTPIAVKAQSAVKAQPVVKTAAVKNAAPAKKMDPLKRTESANKVVPAKKTTQQTKASKVTKNQPAAKSVSAKRTLATATPPIKKGTAAVEKAAPIKKPVAKPATITKSAPLNKSAVVGASAKKLKQAPKPTSKNKVK